MSEVREIHGVAYANNLSNVEPPGTQTVTVRDGYSQVEIYLSSGYPAGLSPAQARHIARMLIDCAIRVEAKQRAKEKEKTAGKREPGKAPA